MNRAIVTVPMLAAAVENALHGFPVYPVKPRGKNPLWRGWQRSATTKVDHLVGVWERHPTANVGIACRGLVVLDADSARGEGALDELSLPATTTVRTRRGVHRYFLGGLRGAKTILPDVELRGQGQGVLGAGSVHPSGHEYEWEIPPWEVAPIPLPAEIRELAAQGGTGETLPRDPQPVLPGGRSVHLLRVAGALRARHGIEDLLPVLAAINGVQCHPPLPVEKVERLAREGAKLAVKPWLIDPIGFVTQDERLSPIARLVLSLLADHADHNGECFPGVRRLAKLGGCRPAVITKATRELEALGRIQVKRSRRGNRYRLLDAPPHPPNRLTSVTPPVTAGPPPGEETSSLDRDHAGDVDRRVRETFREHDGARRRVRRRA